MSAISPGLGLSDAYIKGSLHLMQNGFSFAFRGKDVTVTRVFPVEVDGRPWPVAAVSFLTQDSALKAEDITEGKPWSVPEGQITVRVQGLVINGKPHRITLSLRTKAGRRLRLSFEDKVSEGHT